MGSGSVSIGSDSGSTAGSVCPAESTATTCAEEDAKGWTDAGGYTCGSWMGYECATTAVEWFSYTPAQAAALASCCKTCCAPVKSRPLSRARRV